MKIKTSYDCTFEQRDFANMAKGHDLSATLSDGSVAFRFKMDDDVRAALMGGSFVKQVNGAVADAPRNGQHGPRLLTDGTGKTTKKYTHRGDCPYCKATDIILEPHIRHMHKGKPLHPNGKFRCTQAECVGRFDSRQGLALHLRFSHKVRGPASRKEK